MSAVQLGHRGRLLAAAVAAALTVASVIVAVVATAGQQDAASPPPSAANSAQEQFLSAPTSTRAVSAGTTTRPAVVGPLLRRSLPVLLDVPRIGVRHARLVQLGLAKDGSIQVPPVGAHSPAGWFRGSPTPGQLGASVILGHVDSVAAGPAIFYRLGALRPGDTVTITRADHTAAVFRVSSVRKYAKSNFPTLRVFGDTDHAALRLITCGGRFNPAKASYEDNIVVFAHLVSSHRV